ncbi:MAG: family 43 glycosylhydrolase [Bryobacteraceae bacterium]|nr:family 43 glycosylhydrolase [Bryobacteraceae bacterium]
MTRRELMIALAAAGTGRAATPESAYDTPYKWGKLVLAADPDPASFDSRAVDCPFVFHHDGKFHMTYLGFDGTGYQTGLASSTDLLHWTRRGCILRRDPANPITRYNIALNWILRDTRLRSRGDLKKVNGRYLGVFHAYPNPGYEAGPAVIGLCWSADLLKWEIGDICLRPEDGADWENGGLYKPCLIEHRGTYYLFYNAKNREKRWREQTGVATSTDLKTWRRYEGNPIVRNGGAGSWDERFASDPCVMLDGRKWLLFYFGLDAQGKARDLLATGDSPFQMIKADRILIDVGPSGSVDSVYAHKPSVIWHRGALLHYYCAVSGKWPDEVRGISVASSRLWG